uniref:Uncharacterized protein n=1 Tax=Sphaerodactylus townsendi TaxID=933632 RepID=A0ACB8G338_9SAUR
MTEHNLLAVRVMVTSDGSSSEQESEFCGDSSSSEFNKRQLSSSETRSFTPSSPSLLSLNKSSVRKEEGHAMSKSVNEHDLIAKAAPISFQVSYRKTLLPSQHVT